ncbi:hypothetical protein PF011_g23565 [Phytophthora fragariae]|uniref:Uncharacterized protein n=1 Tax=Phytophthora fragariae TaxID=53985 RepID=A0A6A3IC46_9STRA|nr:hypothetical protein PF011_g23565 [Phytophthora fragariae]
MEESPAPFADAPPPYEWGDEEYDLSDCLLSTWTEGEAILAETVTEDEEAKRANRDFRSSVVSVVYGPLAEAPPRPEQASSVESGSYVQPVQSSGDEELVERSPDDPGEAVAEVEAVPVLSKRRDVDSKVARAVARQAVFRFLQEARSYGKGQGEAREPPDSEEGTVEVPPQRDKIPNFEEGRLLWHADRVKELMSVNASPDEHLHAEC